MTPAQLNIFDADLKEQIRTAETKLRAGEVVAFPTDTLYALGAEALNDVAVARVYAIKNRLLTNPLPLFISDSSMAEAIAVLTIPATLLAQRFWPGALTLVVPKRPEFHS